MTAPQASTSGSTTPSAPAVMIRFSGTERPVPSPFEELRPIRDKVEGLPQDAAAIVMTKVDEQLRLAVDFIRQRIERFRFRHQPRRSGTMLNTFEHQPRC
jgi:hypothetical protein